MVSLKFLTSYQTLIKGLVEVSTKDMAATGALVNDVIARKGGGLVCHPNPIGVVFLPLITLYLQTSVLYGPPGTGTYASSEYLDGHPA